MSLVQSRCRLDLVQHHLSIRFGREMSNKLSVIKLQKNVFLHWFQQQSFISRCWPIVECSFDFTNASLENPRSVGQMEGWPQLWHTTRTGFVASALRRNEFESGGTHPCAGKFLLLCPSTFFWPKSTISRFGERFRDGQYSLASFSFPVPMELAPLFVAVLRDWHSRHWHGCSVIWAPTHISPLLQPPTPIFWKLVGFASISRLALAGAGWRAVAPICPPPRDDANLREIWYWR